MGGWVGRWMDRFYKKTKVEGKSKQERELDNNVCEGLGGQEWVVKSFQNGYYL